MQRGEQRMKRKESTRRTVLKISAVFLAVLLVLSAVLFALSLWDRHHGQYKDSLTVTPDIKVYNGEEYRLKERIETLLVLGLDTYDSIQLESFTNDKCADFLLLMVIDHKDDTCKAIHINRDTMADMHVLGVAGDRVGTVNKQIALSHTYGNGREVSCRNTADAVSRLLGVEVDHYVSVTMDAVPVLNDLVGGVSVEVLNDFSQVDPTLVQGETVNLTGQQALTYVRARYGLDDPTNSQRMKRQKQYLEALYYRANQCVQEDENFVSRAALAVTEYLVSDCSGNKLESMLSQFTANPLSAIYSPDGQSVAGEQYMEFYPTEQSVEEIVINCFYEKKQ